MKTPNNDALEKSWIYEWHKPGEEHKIVIAQSRLGPERRALLETGGRWLVLVHAPTPPIDREDPTRN